MVTTEKKKKKRSKMNEMESVGASQRTPAVCDTAIYIYIYNAQQNANDLARRKQTESERGMERRIHKLLHVCFFQM